MNALIWNSLHVSERKSLLTMSGHSINLAHRAFDFIPKNVIHDIVFTQNLTKRQKNPVVHYVKPSIFQLRYFDTTKNLIKEVDSLTAPDLLDLSLRFNVDLFSSPFDYASALIHELNNMLGTNFNLHSSVIASR